MSGGKPGSRAGYATLFISQYQQGADLFSLLELGPDSKQEKQERQGRPDHRWIIWGPRGSGSTFHKDPNATSAWNAVIKGAKVGGWVVMALWVGGSGYGVRGLVRERLRI